MSQFIHREVQAWLGWAGIKTPYIDPGSPWQNGFIESFHSRCREECLDREQLWTLSEARVVIEDWRLEYSAVRPHKGLGLGTPLALRAGPSPGTMGSHFYGSGISKAMLHRCGVLLGLATPPKGCIGIATSWGSPPDMSRRDQVTSERFYRLRVTGNFTISPDV